MSKLHEIPPMEKNISLNITIPQSEIKMFKKLAKDARDSKKKEYLEANKALLKLNKIERKRMALDKSIEKIKEEFKIAE